jgi:predicted P-loop ATPase
MQPGCQADYVLVLEGPQGIKKSTALRVLAGADWFTDHLADLRTKDAPRLDLQGVWIVELAELVDIRRSDKEQ